MIRACAMCGTLSDSTRSYIPLARLLVTACSQRQGTGFHATCDQSRSAKSAPGLAWNEHATYL